VLPDGSRLLFTATTREVTVFRWEFDPITGLVSKSPASVVTDGRGMYLYSGPSPTGEWVPTILSDQTNGSQVDILLVHATTGEQRRLTNDRLREGQLEWSSDGSRLYFCVTIDGTRELWSIRPDGGGRRRELERTALNEVLDVIASPDGKWLYVETTSGQPSCFVDVSRPVAERKPVPLPALPDGRIFNGLDWSPDARWIIGTPDDRVYGAASEFYVYEFATRSFTRIGSHKTTEGAQWLPDSRHVLLVHGSGELRVVDVVTGSSRGAGSVGKEHWNLKLSRDGRWLFGNTQRHSSDIWMLDYGADQGDEGAAKPRR
jgi:WD40 repeat protein